MVELLARHARPDPVEERMADVFDGHASFAVELLLEVKDAKHLFHALSQLANSPAPPRPNLRADEIDYANAGRAQTLREPQVEVREVNQHGERGSAAPSFTGEPPEGPPGASEARHDFRDAGHREPVGVFESFDARLPHRLAAAPKRREAGNSRPKRRDKLAAVDVPGALARNHHDSRRVHA